MTRTGITGTTNIAGVIISTAVIGAPGALGTAIIANIHGCVGTDGTIGTMAT